MGVYSATIFSAVVFSVVVFAMVVRYSTQYSPDSSAGLWATRLAVIAITLWFVSMFGLEAKVQHGIFGLLSSRRLVRGVVALILVWSVFGDELF